MQILQPTDNNLSPELLNFSPENTIIISSSNPSEIERHFQVFSPKNFYKMVLKKSPKYNQPKILSSIASEYIINTICKTHFKETPNIEKLAKSSIFTQNLAELFGEFFSYNISTTQLKEILTKTQNQINKEDYTRLNAIVHIFEDYCQITQEKGYIDVNYLPLELLNILKTYPNYLHQLQKSILNIIIDSQEALTQTEKAFFTQFKNVFYISFKKTNTDIAATKLKNKYTAQNNEITSSEKSNIELLTFNNAKDEAGYIAQEILDEIKTKKTNFSDYVIALGNCNNAITFEDIFDYLKLPHTSYKSDNSYKCFVNGLIRYCSICKNLSVLESNTLNKAQQEYLQDEININFEQILSEILEDKFAKDKILNIVRNTAETSLIECTKKHLSLLNKNDAKAAKQELETIKKLRNLYTKNEIRLFITTVLENTPNTNTETFKQLFAKFLTRINLIEAIALNGKKDINFEELNKLLETPILETETSQDDCIIITSLKKALNYPNKRIYITGLDENSIPSKADTVKYITEETNSIICANLPEGFSGIVKSPKQNIQKSANLLALLIESSKKTTISIHKYQDKKEISPSIFFQFLQSIFEENSKNIEKTFNKTQEIKSFAQVSQPNTKEQAIEENETLYLSASSISAFQKCPRQFYLGRLLGLTQASSFAANYGTIIHAIMENFNKNYLDKYSSSTLIELSEILFNSIEAPQKAIDRGFKEYETQLVCATDFLSLAEMKSDFHKAVEEMDKNNFFDKIPTLVLSEQDFEFSIPEISNVVFSGRIDAIYKFDNKYKIIDFKTGSPIKPLSKYICDKGVTLTTNTAINNFPYQIPLYYFATQYSQEFEALKNNIDELGLLYLHPKNKNGGYCFNSIPAESLELYKGQIITNLSDTIISKMREYSTFPPNGDMFTCNYCSYNNLCDKDIKEEDV